MSRPGVTPIATAKPLINVRLVDVLEGAPVAPNYEAVINDRDLTIAALKATCDEQLRVIEALSGPVLPGLVSRARVWLLRGMRSGYDEAALMLIADLSHLAPRDPRPAQHDESERDAAVARAEKAEAALLKWQMGEGDTVAEGALRAIRDYAEDRIDGDHVWSDSVLTSIAGMAKAVVGERMPGAKGGE